MIVDRPRKEIEAGYSGKLEGKEVANKKTMTSSINKSLDFEKFGEEDELKTPGALTQALKGKTKAEQLQVMQMQIKIRKYVYRVYRPVEGAWLTGKKAELIAKTDELKGLLKEMIKAEQKEIGRRRPSAVAAAPGRAANPFADQLTRQLDQDYQTKVQMAQKQVGALVAQGVFKAPRAGKPQSKQPRKKGRKKKPVEVRKEATEDEQGMVRNDAQFEDEVRD